MTRMRRAVASAGLAVASGLVGLLGAELLVRSLVPQVVYRFPKGLFTSAPDVRYRLTPGFAGRIRAPEFSTAVRVNQAGLRRGTEVGPKRPGTTRILVAGDSFTMAASVEEEETFVALLERALGARAGGTATQVLNAGVPGYGTRETLAFLQTRGLDLEPDVVLLAFFVGNDVTDNATPAPATVIRGGYLAPADPPPGILPHPLRLFLAANSHLYHLLWPVQRRLRGLPADRGSDPLPVYSKHHPLDSPLWTPTRALLGRVAEVVRDRGRPLAVVLIPDLIQVHPDQWRACCGRRPDLVPDWPNQQLASLAGELALPVLDLLPAMRARRAEGLYFPLDHHLTAAGNRVAAETILPFLEREGLLPAVPPAPSQHARAAGLPPMNEGRP